MNALAHSPEQPLATFDASNPIGAMLQGIIEGGITADKVEALEKMTKLYLQMEDANAKKRFHAAFAQLQQAMPKIVASEPVIVNNQVKYRWAPMEKIMEQVQPVLTEHEFTVRFDTEERQGGGVIAVCILSHGGHSEQTRFATASAAPPGTSAAQAAGSTLSYAKRYALCAALNINPAKFDTDARPRGGPIAPETAAEYRRRLDAIGADHAAFLRFAGADTFEEISESMDAELDQALQKREAQYQSRPAKQRQDIDLTTYEGWRSAMVSLGKSHYVPEAHIGLTIGKLSIDHKVKAPGKTGDAVRRMTYDAAANGALNWETGTLVE